MIARGAFASDLHRRGVDAARAEGEVQQIDAKGDTRRGLRRCSRVLHLHTAIGANTDDESAQRREAGDVRVQTQRVVDDQTRQHRRAARQAARQTQLSGEGLKNLTRILLLETAIQPRLGEFTAAIRDGDQPRALGAFVNAVDVALEHRDFLAITVGERQRALVSKCDSRRGADGRDEQLEHIHFRRKHAADPERLQMIPPRVARRTGQYAGYRIDKTTKA